jgi:TP901 family phage tail tape measure protein
MSEFLAEAQILIRPNTAAFRAELQAQLVAATRGLTVPVPITVVSPVGTAVAAEAARATASTAAANEVLIRSQKAGADAAKENLRHTQKLAQTHEQLRKGVVASAASFTGLRGAVLAASTPFLAATIGVQAFASSIRSAADLERELNIFRETAEATAGEMRRIRDEASALGRDISLPGVSAADAAEAMTELAKAGLNVEDAMAGARGTLQLATAAQISNADAAELAANALNAFQLEGRETAHVADLFAGAATAAQGSISDIGLAFRQVAGVAAPLGVSLKDTVALLTLLAKNGLASSDAGTSLRVAMMNLASPTDRARKELDKLNVQVNDLQGNFRPEVFAEFSRAVDDLSLAEQRRVARIVFGQDAIRAFNLLQREQISGLRAVQKEIDRAQNVERIARAQTQGLAGDMEAASNEASALGTTMGRILSPALSGVLGGFSLAAGAINDATDALERFVDPVPEANRSLDELTADLNQAVQEMMRFQATAGPGLIPPSFQARIDELSKALTAQLPAGLQRSAEGMAVMAQSTRSADDAVTDFTASVSRLTAGQILGRVAGIQEQLVDVRIGAAGRQAELALLREQEGILRKRLEIGGLGLAGRRELKRQLFGILEEQRSIEESMLRDREQAAQEAQRDRDQADQEFINLLGGRRGRAENLLRRAEDTSGLRDDIKLGQRLAEILRDQMDQVRKTVRDAQARKDILASLRRQLIDVLAEIRQDRQEMVEAMRQEAIERRERLQEAARLDIAFAEITENRDAEIRARQRLIVQLKKEQALVKKGSNEWKELRNEIAEEQAAIKETLDETKERGKRFKQLTFELLQQQQGFAANLLSNLLPGGAASAALAGPSQAIARPPVAQGITQAAGIEEARNRLGITAGQGSTLVAEVRRMREAIDRLAGMQDHPEAHRQRRTQRAVMDSVSSNG